MEESNNSAFAELKNIYESGASSEEKTELVKDLVNEYVLDNITETYEIFPDEVSTRFSLYDNYNVDENKQTELQHKFSFKGKDEQEFVTVFSAAAELISIIENSPIPDNIKSIYRGRTIKKEFLRTDDIGYCEVHVKSYKRYEDRKILSLNCHSEEYGDMTVTLTNEWFYTSVWNYALIHLFKLKKEAGTGVYTTGNNSLVVVDPDYMADVSSLAECFSERSDKIFKPHIYTLRRFVISETSPAMIKGNIANSMLDAVLESKEAVFETVFAKCLKEKLIETASFTDIQILEIKQELASKHLSSIFQLARRLKDTDVYTEPSFISPRYGLQGRLDVISERKNKHGVMERDIFELKSGIPPQRGCWVNNEMQAYLYYLLLRSVYLNSHKGRIFIFYSAADLDPQRLVESADKVLLEKIKSITYLRNRIAAAEHKLSIGNMEHLREIDFDKVSRFQQEAAVKFKHAYENAFPEVRKYFDSFIPFVYREMRAAKLGCPKQGNNDKGYSALWRTELSHKIKDNTVLAGLSYISSQGSSFTFKRDNYSGNTIFREEDIVLLYPQENSYTADATRHQLHRGRITHLTNDTVTVTLANKLVTENYFTQYNQWVLEGDFMEQNYNSMINSLYDFLLADKSKAELLLGMRMPEHNTERYEYDNPALKKSQNEIVRKALEAKEYFLIQGPPGTGKTSAVLTSIVSELLKTEDDLLILAFTNKASDEVCTKLAGKGIEYLRLGRGDENSLYELQKDHSRKELLEILNSRRVIVSTVAGYLKCAYELEKIKNFKTVIIDEASQLLEPHVAGVLSRAEKFILIGDQNQLPAVCIQPDTACRIEDETLKSLGFSSSKVSLFERLYSLCKQAECSHAYDMLTEHFRMHSEIADTVNCYYDSNLQCGSDKQKEELTVLNGEVKCDLTKKILSNRVTFLDVRNDNEEAKTIAKILNSIKNYYGDKFSDKTAGVITPWRRQINNILSCINDEEIKSKVTIDTVERFQGSERDIIIISLALNNGKQIAHMQSLTSDGKVDRKLNVALSRAKEYLVVIGRKNVIEQNHHYSELLDKCNILN